MKKKTPNILSLSIRLLCLSILLICTFLIEAKIDLGNTVPSAKENIEAKPVLSSVMYTQSNQSFNFSDTTVSLVLLKNNRNCLECFISMNNFVHYFRKSTNARFIVVNLIDSTVLDRKRTYLTNKELMPDFDDYLFQYKNTPTFFSHLNTDYTPELILIRKDSVAYIPNNRIFDYPGMEINQNISREISEFLK